MITDSAAIECDALEASLEIAAAMVGAPREPSLGEFRGIRQSGERCELAVMPATHLPTNLT
jgi:hypothetical protein